jgi:hypothetical protein
VISWSVVVLMYILYRLLTKYFKDQELDSFELVKLLGIYMAILGVVMASYIDVSEIMKRANAKYSFFIIVLSSLVIVVLMAWAAKNPKEKKYWILGTLYTPILLLMMTNGRILEHQSESLNSLLPRSNFTFLNLPGESLNMSVGGVVGVEQIKVIESMINSHPKVKESAVVIKKDKDDNLLKPYAMVVLNVEKPKDTTKIEQEIKTYVSDKIDSNWISPEMYSADVDFVDDMIDLEKLGTGSAQQEKARKIINQHESVQDSRVIGSPKEAIAYILLKQPYSQTNAQANQILDFTYKKIKEINKISDYLKPRWVAIVDEIPKDGKEIKRNVLQKKAKNWSDLFPEAPENDSFIKELQ